MPNRTWIARHRPPSILAIIAGTVLGGLVLALVGRALKED